MGYKKKSREIYTKLFSHIQLSPPCLVLFILSLCIHSTVIGQNISSNKNRSCEKKLLILDTLLMQKVSYEKAVRQGADLNNQHTHREMYRNYVDRVKNHQQEIVTCIDLLLADSTYGRNKIVKFNYINPLSSTISSCDLLNWREFLKIVKYNLTIVKSDTAFICEDAQN